jgi:hypothetical protein
MLSCGGIEGDMDKVDRWLGNRLKDIHGFIDGVFGDELHAKTAKTVNYYAKRWTIEPNFRDTKDLRFGMGLGATRIGEPTRRDRLLPIDAFAMVLLTLLGAAGESLGMDRLLKSNTSKIRTHSLFRQGCMLYEPIPTMPDSRLTPLMSRFAETLSQCPSFGGLFEIV